MTEAFIGLTVELKLHDGFIVRGIVSMVNPATQQLQLEHVTTISPHGMQQHWPTHHVAGERIVDLRIIEKSTPNTQTASLSLTSIPNYGQQAPQTLSMPSSLPVPLNLPPDPAIISTHRPSIPHHTPVPSSQPSTRPVLPSLERDQPGLSDTSTSTLLEHTTSSLLLQTRQSTIQSGSSDITSNATLNPPLDRAETPMTEATDSDAPMDTRPKPPRKKRKSRIAHSRLNSDVNEWARGDVNEFIEEDFDFQQNLILFDKKKVFEEIRETDSTAPEDRLVSHNKRDTRVRNLLPSENVLSRAELEEETDNGSDTDTWRDNNDHSNYTFKTTDGSPCWAVTGVQMLEVERMAVTETGPNEEQMIENGGRSAASLCLQVMGGSRRVLASNHNEPPLVVILAGNNKSGAYGLAAGRHLLNHGCEVVACTVGKERQLGKHTRQQQAYLRASGGRIARSVKELPSRFTQPVDLIVDALLGYQYTLRELPNDYARSSVCDLISWANDNKTPVLSLDIPSGIDGTTGLPGEQDVYITPRWTLCMGAPKTGLTGLSMSGEVFLADLGLPRTLWKRVGIPGWTVPPWGADFVIGLRYA